MNPQTIDDVIASIKKDEWASKLAENNINADALSGEAAIFLQRFIAVKYYSQKFNLSEAELFYEQFYWFSKFIKQTELQTNKENESLRQQRFKLIEQASNEDLIIDWDKVEEMQNEIEKL